MKEISCETLTTAAESYLDTKLKAHHASIELIGGSAGRDLILLLMAGFAAEQVIAELREVFGIDAPENGAGSGG